MDGKPISAVDAIGPAFESTKNFMFRPFQWSRWWRFAVLGVATGEFASTGGCNPSSFTNIINSTKQQHPQQFSGFKFPNLGLSSAQIVLMITVLVVGVAALVVVHLYIGSVLRFVLFDGVSAGRYRLRAGWSRWHGHGFRYFLFQLVLIFISLAGYAVLIGIPAIAAAAAGIFHNPHEHVGLLVLGLIILLPVLLLYVVLLALINLAAKDFAVPMMALENTPITAALGRIWAMVRAAKGEYAGYVGIKIVLSIVIGIVMAIVQFFVLLVVFMPVVVAAVAIGIATPAVFQNPLMLAFAITAFMLLVILLLFVIGIISAPIVYFFESYVLTFFSWRYPPLWDVLHSVLPIQSPPDGGMSGPEITPAQNPPLENPPEPSPAG